MSSPSLSVYTPTPSTRTFLFTPQQYPPTSPSPLSYTPQTPSPLRTSRNANLMPPPPTPTAPTKSSPLASIENVWNTASIDENTFAFSPSISTPNPFAKESSFSRRSRSQSPVTELGSRTSAARDRRKSLFLEQIRTKREDEKLEARGEQVLRMDWVREEAERKARLARQAQKIEAEFEEDDMMLDDAERGPSPTEERELEELIRLHEESQWQGDAGQDDMMDDLDDEDYDQLFMEVIGGNQDQGSGMVLQQPVLWSQQVSNMDQESVPETRNTDEAMDMS